MNHIAGPALRRPTPSIRGSGLAVALLVLGAAPTAWADASVRSIHRAEISPDGELSLCVSGRPTPRSGETHYTLYADTRARRASGFEPGCGPHGGHRLSIGRGRRDAVYVSGGAVIYVPASGREVRLAVVAEPVLGPVAQAATVPGRARLAPRPRTDRGRYPRLSEREGSHRVIVAGPRASEIGDVAAGTVLGGLEETLDPVVEPALAIGLRTAFAGIGTLVGAALYVPVTLLDVLDSEL